MKIGYIGRNEIFDLLIENNIFNKLDINYNSTQENLYKLNNEIIKFYKIPLLDELYIDFCCIESDAEATKIINSAMAVRYNTKIYIVINDRKYINNNFNIINLTNKRHKEAPILNEIKDIEFEINKVDIVEKDLKSKPKKKSSINLSIPKISIPKISIKPYKKKTKEIKEKQITFPFDSISFKNIFPKKTKKDAIELDNIKDTEESINFKFGIKGKIPFLLNKKINIFYSNLDLQGTSYLSNLYHSSDIAIIDLDLSYIKYTEFKSMTEYIDNTFISPLDLKKNDYNIYTLDTSNILSSIKIINYLLTQYNNIIIDIKNEEYFNTLKDIIDAEVYIVVDNQFKNLNNIIEDNNATLVIIDRQNKISINEIKDIKKYKDILKVG